MKNASHVRRDAVMLYMDIVRGGAYANLHLQKYARSVEDDRDIGFVYELVLGTVDRRLYLSYIVSHFARAKKLKPVIEAILLLGAYQILFMERVPDHAVCNESVEIARSMGLAPLSGFVNGVLRTLSREKDRLPAPEREADRLGYASVMGSWPRWIIERWADAYGEDIAEQLALYEAPRANAIRLNSLCVTEAQWDAYCAEKGIACARGRWEREALYAQGLRHIENDAAFRKGWYSVQGESAMLAVRAAMPAGRTVLDACSAPGGKAACLAEWTSDQTDILCWDIHPHRTELIAQTAKRLGLNGLRIAVQDALQKREELCGAFDTVLLDAPCSGFGVFGKSDVKWRRSEADITSLCALQRELLDVCSAYVRPGGHLVYSTCTTLAEENTMQMDTFLVRHSAFEMIPLHGLVPQGITDACDVHGALRLLPPLHGVEGFYIAKLQRKAQ